MLSGNFRPGRNHQTNYPSLSARGGITKLTVEAFPPGAELPIMLSGDFRPGRKSKYWQYIGSCIHFACKNPSKTMLFKKCPIFVLKNYNKTYSCS